MKFLAPIGKTLAEKPAIRRLLDAPEDSEEVLFPPPPKVVLGLLIIGVSYTIGWPVIAVCGYMSVSLKKPLLLAAGGPIIWGISHLVWMAGMALVGAETIKKGPLLYRKFMRWLVLDLLA